MKKCFRMFVVATLFTLGAALSWSQADQHDEAKPQQEQPEGRVAHPEKPEGKSDEMKPPKEEKRDAGKMQEQQESKPEHPEKQQKEQKKEAMERNDHARPAGKSAHIPDDKFKAHFGREHSFTVTRVVHETTIVPGRTSFPYGGYNFVFVDPWPAGWLVSDECYVDYIDGEYFLFDVLHPGVRVALFVQM